MMDTTIVANHFFSQLRNERHDGLHSQSGKSEPLASDDALFEVISIAPNRANLSI